MVEAILFGKTEEKIVQKFKPYIRCELCKYSEVRKIDPPEYIHCTKYPNMISHKELTCKSSEYKR